MPSILRTQVSLLSGGLGIYRIIYKQYLNLMAVNLHAFM